MTIWAFNKVDDPNIRELVYSSLKEGKSRFGWSSYNENDLRIEGNWTENHSKQLFLLDIQKGDWIVHINTPEWGKCVAAKVIAEYDFDDGIVVDWGPGKDFRHFLRVDVQTIIEFERRNPNILPTVNLNPRQRYHRVHAEEDFLQSIENLKNDTFSIEAGELRGDAHLKNKTDEYLSEITALIHEMYRSKDLERFLARVIRNIPTVINVKENGSGWGTDFGADLIVTTNTPIGNLNFENIIIVQIKSYEGEHYDLKAVEQIKTGINEYHASAGIIITTAQRTEQLENEIQKVSKDIGCQIDLLAGEDVARFVIKHAPELLFKL